MGINVYGEIPAHVLLAGLPLRARLALMSGGAYWESIPLEQIPEIPSSCAQLPSGEEFPQIVSVQRADGGHRLALFPSFRQEPETVTH